MPYTDTYPSGVMYSKYKTAAFQIFLVLSLILVVANAAYRFPPNNLYGSDGSYAGVNPWDVPNGLSRTSLYQQYGPEALQRAKNWSQSGKVLW